MAISGSVTVKGNFNNSRLNSSSGAGDCYPPFPDHAGSLELQHNEFKSDHSSAEKWIAQCDEIGEVGGIATPEWESPEHRQRAIDTNEVWTLHWYPNTPIGFNYIAAPTFDELLKFAKSCG